MLLLLASGLRALPTFPLLAALLFHSLLLLLLTFGLRTLPGLWLPATVLFAAGLIDLLALGGEALAFLCFANALLLGLAALGARVDGAALGAWTGAVGLRGAVYPLLAHAPVVAGRRWAVAPINPRGAEVERIVAHPPILVVPVVAAIHPPDIKRARAPLLDENERRTSHVDDARGVDDVGHIHRIAHEDDSFLRRQKLPREAVIAKLLHGDEVEIRGRHPFGPVCTRGERSPADVALAFAPSNPRGGPICPRHPDPAGADKPGPPAIVVGRPAKRFI